MAYSKEELARIRRRGSERAIALAIQGRWREAIAVNENLIKNFTNNVDAYNRLGRAHMELGEYPEARQAYGRALELDPYNVIARKNLKRLQHLGEFRVAGGDSDQRVEPQGFIKETGKAGVLALCRLAPVTVLASVVAGDEVNLKEEGSALVVKTRRDAYLGQVDPKHSKRLIGLINGGNRYNARVVSITEDAVSIIIRETYQHPDQLGQLSFPPKGFERTRPPVGDRLLHYERAYEEADEEPGYSIIDNDGEIESGNQEHRDSD